MEAFGSQEPFPEIDVTLIERRLRMTPTERWEAHRRALALATEIRRARARRLVKELRELKKRTDLA